MYAGGFVVGRIAHAFGVSRSSGTSAGRLAGMLLTFIPIVAVSVTLLTITARQL